VTRFQPKQQYKQHICTDEVVQKQNNGKVGAKTMQPMQQ